MGSTFLNLEAVVVKSRELPELVCINIQGLNVMTFTLRVGLQEVCVCGQWTIECGGEDQ